MSRVRKLPAAALGGLLALGVIILALSLRPMSAQSQNPTTKKQADGKKVTAKPQTLAGFDGDRAYQYLVDQCKIGPRISGTDGNRKLQKMMSEHFSSVGAQVRFQAFAARHPISGDAVEMVNVVASFSPDRPRRVLIGAHFDTRPNPDKEPNPRNRSKPFLGANDGASGVAVLMELANLMDQLTTTVGVDLVAFDGEELVYDEQGEYFLGSTHFAQQYRRSAGQAKYAAAIVVDMVGDKSLEICPDVEGNTRAPQLRQSVWAVAKKLRASGFKENRTYDVRDDHLPLLDVGIPAIDLIDFNYPHWHLASDLPDKCSPASLAQVGGVLAEWLRGQ